MTITKNLPLNKTVDPPWPLYMVKPHVFLVTNRTVEKIYIEYIDFTGT